MSKLMENFMFSSEHELQVDFTEVFFFELICMILGANVAVYDSLLED